MMMTSLVRKAVSPLGPGAEWENAQWRNAEEISLENRIGDDSGHRPGVRVKMLYDDKAIAGIFRVEDRYVVGRTTGDQQPVCQDSCVEFFVHPAGDPRYYNFEMSCTGNLLLYHITDCRGEIFDKMPQRELDRIVRKSSLPRRVEPEIADPVTWEMSFYIPVDFFVRNSRISPALAGQVWRANFTKCADDSSHPHWLTWVPLSRRDFHLPLEFGEIIFSEK
ncbi:MAG: carbohydrate-binding family 9-like protein [Victivallaceae bacterium]|nr:carbohydrate-binding family 9-like protein [Victivallaceae bacterium]